MSSSGKRESFDCFLIQVIRLMQAWPSHQVFCVSTSRIDVLRQRWARYSPARRAQRRFVVADGEEVTSPYESGMLTGALQEDVIKIRKSLRQWLALSEAWQEGAEGEIVKATVDVASA